MEEKLGWYCHPTFEKWAGRFEDKYQLVDVLMIGDPKFAKNKIWKQEGRFCIFCNKGYPEANFKNSAHLISRMIGNTDLFSTFECDACNHKFSLLETDLASFLGLGRSIIGLKEDRKPPGFPGIGLEAKSILFKGKKLLVIHKENAVRNADELTTKLDYQKPTYTPANVYKLFLKCALSILPKDEVTSNFQVALKYLQGGTVLGGAHINIFTFPVTVSMPLHAYIFRRKNDKDSLPVYIAAFYFQNKVVTLPVLLNHDDLINLNQAIEIPAAPPYFVYGNEMYKYEASFATHYLGSPFKLKSELDELTIQFDKSDLEKTFGIDLKTGEEILGAYEPAGSKYVIAMEEGISFTKEELPKLLAIIENRFSCEK